MLGMSNIKKDLKVAYQYMSQAVFICVVQQTVTHAKHWVSLAWLLKVPGGQASQRREVALKM